MIEAISSKKTETLLPTTPENPSLPPCNTPTSDKSNEKPTSAYTLSVSEAGRTKQSVMEKCRSDYQCRVRDMVEAGGNAIESHAVAYRKIRDKIATDCPENLRRDAMAMLDREFEKGVTDAANELSASFGNFFNYASQQNGKYHFNLDDRPVFNVADFREKVLKMAYQAQTATLRSEKTDTESLQLALRKSLAKNFHGEKLETMSFGDIRTLDTVLRNLPALTPTDNLQQIGHRSAMWEIIGDHLASNEGLSKPIREKTLATLMNNLQLYQKIGEFKNGDQSLDIIQRTIATARAAEKAEFYKGKPDHPLAKLREKLWIVEGEWRTAT